MDTNVRHNLHVYFVGRRATLRGESGAIVNVDSGAVTGRFGVWFAPDSNGPDMPIAELVGLTDPFLSIDAGQPLDPDAEAASIDAALAARVR